VRATTAKAILSASLDQLNGRSVSCNFYVTYFYQDKRLGETRIREPESHRSMASSNEAQFNSSKDFFKNQIENLYDVENRLTNTLPKMADAAGSGALRQAFQNHLYETKGHVSRLEVIFREMKVDPRRETCQAVKGLIAQAEKAIGRTGNSAVKDAELVAAAQQVERYEMTAYGKACMIARQLGLEMAVRLLQQTLNEEDAGNYELTLIARRMINIQVIVKWASGERHVCLPGH